jgi:glycosyltransferase involved in cell wall biosynthesis
MIRVLYILGHGAFGGIERHVQALIRNLDRSIVCPSVCVLMEAGPVSDAIAVEGVRVDVLGTRRGFDPRIFIRLKRLVNVVRPDIIHTHEMHSQSALALWALPRITTVHTEHCSLRRSPSPFKSALLWRTLARRIDCVVAVSEDTRRSVVQEGRFPASRTVVIPNSLDLTVLPAKNPGSLQSELRVGPETRLVGAVGRLAEQKDWPSFLRVCAEIMARRDDVAFVVVGDGALRDRLERLAGELCLTRRIHWLGWRKDAIAIVGMLDLFLMTSEHEELPTTLLEAMALRTPIVGFLPEGGAKEVLACSPQVPPAILLRDRNVEAAASLVCEVLDNPEKASHLTEAGWQVVCNYFNMEETARRMTELYCRLLSERTPHTQVSTAQR